MIFTIIVGVVAGIYYGQANGLIGQALDKLGIALDEATLPLFSLAVVLAVAALILSLVGIGAYPVALCLAAAVGVARKPILARITGNS